MLERIIKSPGQLLIVDGGGVPVSIPLRLVLCLGCGQGAYRADARAKPTNPKAAKFYQHIDGSPINSGDLVKCDTCQAPGLPVFQADGWLAHVPTATELRIPHHEQ